MANGQLGTVMQYIRRLVVAKTTRDLTDRELLHRYCALRDEGAFAALVQRHAQLVWSVCRQVLHHEQDAEDAWQASILVLARYAPRIRKTEALASWLHGVAYRTALMAKRGAAIRRAHERRERNMPNQKPDADVTWRELQAVLAEEVQRLPEKYRAPFVLCCLEGKSKLEAAQELGWKEGTVSGRLAQARKQMQQRLVRRGMALSAILCAAALKQSAVQAALVNSTIRAALQFAADKTVAAGIVSGHVAALAEGVTQAMFATKIKIATVFVLALGLVVSGAGVATHRQAAAQAAADAKQKPEATCQNPEVDAKKPAAKDETPRLSAKSGALFTAPGEHQELMISGRVLDSEGKPVPKAQVAVLSRQEVHLGLEGTVSERNEVVAQGRADNEGRFRFTVPRPGAVPQWEVRIVATAGGHGLNWKATNPQADNAEAELRLLPEQPVRGKLVDLQGEPAADVKVRLTGMSRKGAESDPDRTLPLPEQGLPFGLGTATTNAKGSFAILGVGRGVTIDLEIRDDRFALQPNLWVETADRARAENVRLQLRPPQVLHGRVVAEATGKPVPHARLEVATFFESAEGSIFGNRTFVESDAQGRYRVNLPANLSPGYDPNLAVCPPAGEPYLGVSKTFRFPRGAVKHEMDIALPPGIVVRGKVTEGPSGKAVAGAFVEYHAPLKSADRDDVPTWARFTRVATSADGRYAIAVRPGTGTLVVRGPTPDYIPKVIGSGELQLGKPGGDPLYYDGIARLNAKQGEQPKEVSFSVQRGVTIKCRMVDPAGKPVRRAVVFCQGHRPAYEKRLVPISVEGGKFELRGCDPEKAYRLLCLTCPEKPQLIFGPGSGDQLFIPSLIGPQNKLGTVVEVSAKKAAASELVITLAPCGSAKLRFLDQQGKPWAKYGPPWLELVVTPGPSLSQALEKRVLAAETVILIYGVQSRDYTPPQADDQGRMTVEGLIPGATYRVMEGLNRAYANFTVEAGKAKEVTINVNK